MSMTPERWQQVKDVLHDVLAQPPADRAALLARVGQTDPDLVREVDSLLAAHDDAGSFIVEPALAGAGAAAVHYAHQHLVVHRDLKAGNILVTADGAPKLLDFGIAKLLGDEAHDRTMTVMRVMTLDSASPEQVRGETVTTATDVYALGVLL